MTEDAHRPSCAVTGRFTMTRDILRTTVARAQPRGLLPLMRFLAVFYGVMWTFVLLMVLSGTVAPSTFTPTGVAMGGIVPASLLFAWWKTRRQLAGHPALNRTVVVTVAETGIRWEVDGLAASEWSWTAVREVVAWPDGLLMAAKASERLWIPAVAFSVGDRGRVEALAEAAVPLRRVG